MHEGPRGVPHTLPVPQPVFDAAAEALRDRGWWSGTRVLSDDLIATLRADLDELMAEDRLYRAGVGRDTDHQINREVRSDRVFWLTRRRPVQRLFLEQMEQLRLALNRRLFLALFEFEAHYAHYPPGARYIRHHDSFRGAANRIVSVVAYLTENWQPGDGGELRIYAEASDEVVATIEPRAGSLVLFLSEEFPHEVVPANADRTSIAGWFRLNSSIGGQIDPPR